MEIGKNCKIKKLGALIKGVIKCLNIKKKQKNIKQVSQEKW